MLKRRLKKDREDTKQKHVFIDPVKRLREPRHDKDEPLDTEDELEEAVKGRHLIIEEIREWMGSLGWMKYPVLTVAALAAVILALAVYINISRYITNITTASYPVTAITAENNKTYAQGEKYENSDFTVKAEHENGKFTTLSDDEFTVSQDCPNRTGSITPVTITLNSNPYISTECRLTNVREFVMSFDCGTPEITSVKAVLYSNGELSFEGEGDVAKFDNSKYPWLHYSGDDDYPVTSVSFEDTVAPTSMDEWFDGLDTLTYIQAIPESVRSMRYTFKDCRSLTESADWSSCTALYDITGCYKDCENLTDASALISCIREADKAYEGCVSLETAPDLTGAGSLSSARFMFDGCSNLSECGPLSSNLNDISSMFKDCINLKEAPSLPKKLLKMNSTFSGCLSLETASEIPAAVTDISGCYSECRMLAGRVTVNCNAEKFSGFLRGTGLATYIDITGSSMYLDVYANDSDSERITVNGSLPDEALTSVRAVQQAMQEAAKETAEDEEISASSENKEAADSVTDNASEADPASEEGLDMQK